MKIGIDIMGGDFAPKAAVLGAKAAASKMKPGNKIVLIGDREQALMYLDGAYPDVLEIVHTTETIGMGDNPAKAFSRKQDSSITVGFKLLSEGVIDGFASAGNTGAMLVGAMLTVKSVPGVIRPAIAGLIPRPSKSPTILLDVGINPECKPEVLYQYGIMGSIYAETALGIENPTVGLLNIGEEEEKGSTMVKATFALMKGTEDFNFIGNFEANGFFQDTTPDVVVCDGFVGNVVLKEAETLYKLVKARNIEDPFFDNFDFQRIGGTPILGVNGNVTIGHGISKELAIENLILQTERIVETGLVKKVREKLFSKEEKLV